MQMMSDTSSVSATMSEGSGLPGGGGASESPSGSTNWADIAGAIGRIPSGLFILTTRDGERDVPLLVSWVQQAGFSPPTITVAIRADRPIAGALRSFGAFALSTLGEDQADLVSRFARRPGEGEDPFFELFVERTPNGCLVLQEAVASLDCKVVGEVQAGDHVVFVGEVTGGRVQRDVRPWTHIRKNGLRY